MGFIACFGSRRGVLGCFDGVFGWGVGGGEGMDGGMDGGSSAHVCN